MQNCYHRKGGVCIIEHVGGSENGLDPYDPLCAFNRNIMKWHWIWGYHIFRETHIMGLEDASLRSSQTHCQTKFPIIEGLQWLHWIVCLYPKRVGNHFSSPVLLLLLYSSQSTKKMAGNAAIFAPLSFDLLSTFGATAQQLTKEKNQQSPPVSQLQLLRFKGSEGRSQCMRPLA